MAEIIYQHAHAAGGDTDWGPGKNSFGAMWAVAEDKLRFHKGKGFTIRERPEDAGPKRRLTEVAEKLEPRLQGADLDTVFAVRSELEDHYTLLFRRHAAPLSKGDLVVAAAARRVGTPYDFGVTDCSWLSGQCVEDVSGIVLPHNAHAQRLDPRVKAITKAQLKPGDLVFIDDDAHVAIYLDNQFGGRVWDTEPHDTSVPSNWMPDTNGMLGTGVRIRPMFLPWYCGRINACGRIPEING